MIAAARGAIESFQRRRTISVVHRELRRSGHDVSREWVEQRYEMLSLREHMRALGFPVDDLTDEELIEGLSRIGGGLRACGVSAEEFARGCAALASLSANAGEIARR